MKINPARLAVLLQLVLGTAALIFAIVMACTGRPLLQWIFPVIFSLALILLGLLSLADSRKK